MEGPSTSACTNTTPATAASLGLYSGTGTLTATYGALSSTGRCRVAPVLPDRGVALNGDPVQAGMPAAMLQLYGTDGTGAGSDDIAVFSSATLPPLAELRRFAKQEPAAPLAPRRSQARARTRRHNPRWRPRAAAFRCTCAETGR